MNEYEKLYSGIVKVAWGYFFIYFDLKINGISLLPAFIGYFLLLSAVRGLGEVERDLKLLRIPGAILASWHLATWLCSLGPLNFVGALPIVDLLISIVNIYYQFQLLTNLASIASANQPAGSALDRQILGCRTLQTILLTVIILVRQVNLWLIESGIPVIVMAIVHLLVGIYLMHVLFDLRRNLSKDASGEDPQPQP